MDIPALVSRMVLQLLLAVLEFLSIQSLELFYYINIYTCVHVSINVSWNRLLKMHLLHLKHCSVGIFVIMKSCVYTRD